MEKCIADIYKAVELDDADDPHIADQFHKINNYPMAGQPNEYISRFTVNLFQDPSVHSYRFDYSINERCNQVDRIQSKKMWIGSIEFVEGNNVECRISDPNTNIDELISFELEEFEESERHLISEGATFEYHIGYTYTQYGRRGLMSLIKLDRYSNLFTKIDAEPLIEQYKQSVSTYLDSMKIA